MRGIGVGQKIHVYIIPEVQELMQRELRHAIMPKHEHVLEDVVAWLVVNSLRSEQTQWTMLCIQNIGNLYRKNAFKCLHNHTQDFINIEGEGETTSLPLVTSDPFVDNLNKDESLKVNSDAMMIINAVRFLNASFH